MAPMSPKQLAKRIEKLRVKAPLTKSYERSLIARGIWDSKGVWYTTQKEHWLGWLSQYEGPGAYDRKVWRGRSAKFAYNHIGCPPMLLWLAEAGVIPRTQVLAAKRHALSTARTRATHCAVLRSILPWSLIEARLCGSKRNAPDRRIGGSV